MMLVGFSAANPAQDLFGSNWITHPDDPKKFLLEFFSYGFLSNTARHNECLTFHFCQ